MRSQNQAGLAICRYGPGPFLESLQLCRPHAERKQEIRRWVEFVTDYPGVEPVLELFGYC